MEAQGPRVLGRYSLYDQIAAGGMATVHYGRLLADAGFSRTVAVKMLHPHFAKDPDFVSMFLDEARLAARIRHPNVVQTLDVVALEGELFLVMEYVHGESLSRALRTSSEEGTRAPLDVASAVVCNVLHGLHAAHEATNDRGEPLNIVHRDISPQNILVGSDGAARLIDFGVAKAADRSHTTRDGNIKGKLGYMAPEQLHDKKLDRRTDVFASGIVLWEMITGRLLFRANTEAATVQRVLELSIEPPSRYVPEIPKALERVVLRALERRPSDRFATAREMALALESSMPVASATKVASWLEDVVGHVLAARARTLARIEEGSDASAPSVAKVADDPTAVATLVDPVEPPSQVSSVSLASTGNRPIRKRASRWASYGLVALVAAVGGVLASRSSVSEPPRSAPPAGAASVPVASDPTASPVIVVDTPPPVLEQPAPVLAETAAAPAKNPPRPRIAPARPSKTRAPTPAPAAVTKRPCVPSFVDDAGIKQYRDCP